MNNYIIIDVLMEYVIEGNFEKVVDILSTMHDVNKVCYNGYSTLHHAAANGHIKLVEYLISKGHKINWRDEASGATPIHNAVKNNHAKILKMLMLNGGEINIKDFHGKEPLHYASENGNLEIVDLLLSKGHSKLIAMLLRTGADVTSQDHHGRTALHYAAQQGHLKVVELLLSNKYSNLGIVSITKGIDIDLQDENGSTAFFYSVVGGHFEVAKLFYSKGANINIVNKEGDTSLMAASRKGRLDVFEFLIRMGAEIFTQNIYGNDAFLIAAKNGHVDIVLKLLELGANINRCNAERKNALILAVEHHHLQTTHVLLKRGIELNHVDLNRDSAILIAVRHGNVSIFKQLLEMGSDLMLSNLKGENVIFAASQYGNAEIFDLILAQYRGFDANAEVSRLALLNAVKFGHFPIVRTLLDKGVDIHTRDSHGDTLLHLSAFYGYEGIVKYLLDRGVDVNTRNALGETPLHKAAAYGRSTKIVMLFLEKGADIEAEDLAGKNPLNVAATRSQFNVFEILLKNNPENYALRKAMLKAASKLPPSLAKILSNSRKLIQKYRNAPGTGKSEKGAVQETVDLSTIVQSIQDQEFFNHLPPEIMQYIDKLDAIRDYRLQLIFHWIGLKASEKVSEDALSAVLRSANVEIASMHDLDLIHAIYYTSDSNYSKLCLFDNNRQEYYPSEEAKLDQYFATLEVFDQVIAPYIENLLIQHQNEELFAYSNFLLKRLSKLKGLEDLKPSERIEKCRIYEQKAWKLSHSPDFSELIGIKNALYRYKFIKNSQDEFDNYPAQKRENFYIEMRILERKYLPIQKGEYLGYIHKYEDILDIINFCKTCIHYCAFLNHHH